MEETRLRCFLLAQIILLVICPSVALDLQLRLVNGTHDREGRVEIKLGHRKWGRVCGEGFDNRDATVVCKQLGLGNSGEARGKASFGVGPGYVELDGVICEGSESVLSDCYLYGVGMRTCPHHNSAGVVCFDERDGDLLLQQQNCSSGYFGYHCNLPCHCYGNDECNMVTGSCPRGCASGYWGHGCQLLDECYYNGQIRSYMGSVNRTEGGTPCQDWRRQAPQEHSYTPDHFPDSRFPDNYCRVTADVTRAWCYQVRGKRWDYCLVVNCACPVGLFGHNCGQMCHCKDLDENCNSVLGHCQSGCDEGWTGFDCQQLARSVLPDSNKSNALRKLAKSNMTAQTVQRVRRVLERQGEVWAADVVEVTSVLQRASQLSSISPQMALDLLLILDSVADLDQTVLQDSNSVGNITNRLIGTMGRLADRVSFQQEGGAEAAAGHLRLDTNHTCLHIWNLSASTDALSSSSSSSSSSPSFWGLRLLDYGDFRTVRNVSSSASDSVTILWDDAEGVKGNFGRVVAAVLLPGEVVRRVLEVSAGRDVRLSASVIQQTALFQASMAANTADMSGSQTTELWTRAVWEGSSKFQHHYSLGSRVVVSMRLTVDGQAITDLTSFDQGHVTTVFQPLQLRNKARCVFWDLTLENGRGGWSEHGCWLHSVPSGAVICRCGHLSTFALLLDDRDWYGDDMLGRYLQDSFVLRTGPTVGLVISACVLAVFMLFFLLVRKLRQSRSQQALFNMALATLVSWIVFLAGIQFGESHGVCVAVDVLLHYSIVASLLWALVLGVLYYVTLVKAESQPVSRFFTFKAAAFAWGLPLIQVFIERAMDEHLYRVVMISDYCWLSWRLVCEQAAMIAVVIIVLYVLVMVRLCRHRGGRGSIAIGSSSSSSGGGGGGGGGDSDCGGGSHDYSGTGVCVSFCCFCLLVMSWIFMVLAFEGVAHPPTLAYLFACSAALLGSVLVMFTARHPAVRELFYLNAACRGWKRSEIRSFRFREEQGGDDHADGDADAVSHASASMETSLSPS